ncbi:hypothetical protein D5S17_05055 [Pseudonocardiaceae bacterium YIM PH 21723]|nr:hypothetical protein D5S17_05055 [Pseudonocardiaceae bacterium YIM PH 21723]
MTQEAAWTPDHIDTTVPSAARIYDYMLGGAHNFAADRLLGARVMTMDPNIRVTARLIRSALGRMVRFLVDQGIRQFLDLGSGIPTVANVHEIAQGMDPVCRVVYVDIDPIAVAHSELLLVGNGRAEVLGADLRNPDSVLSSEQVTRQLNLQEPIAVLCSSVLHFVSDSDGLPDIMRTYRDAVCSGSYLAISQVGLGMGTETKGKVDDALRRSGSQERVTGRTREQVLELFGEFELVEPGLVNAAGWRPSGPSDMSGLGTVNKDFHTGVARKL